MVYETSIAECGAASLAMVLGYHGKHVALDRVRGALAVSRDGVSALVGPAPDIGYTAEVVGTIRITPLAQTARLCSLKKPRSAP
jgi:ABC-type bacteriocin/lantibiotic exporter with double-glycine peptidase domain